MLRHNDVMFCLWTMLFTFKEKCFTKILRQEKGLGGKRNGLLVRLTKTIFYRKSSVASHRLIKGRNHFSESMMGFWWHPSQYPKPARHQLTLSTIRQRNQGRCKLLRRNSAAAMSSPGDSSEVRRSFRVFTGRRASEVNCRVGLLKFLQRTVPNFIEMSQQ